MFYESKTKANGLRFFFPLTEAREKQVNQSLSGLTEQDALSADSTAADGITSKWSLFYQQAEHVKPRKQSCITTEETWYPSMEYGQKKYSSKQFIFSGTNL